jgi:hypothetical protein
MSYLRRTIVALAVAILATGCGSQSQPAGGNAVSSDGATGPPLTGAAVDVPPSGSATGGPPSRPAGDPPPTPALQPISPAPGLRERVASWHLAGQLDGGRRLLVDVAIGGPPCDTVTGVDVDESTTTVRVTVHAGRLTSAVCPSGVAGSLATARVEARLHRPLGERKLLGAG